VRIAILGPGAVGGFLAGALERSGQRATLVAREPAAELIARHGLDVDSVRLGRFSVRPRAVFRLQEEPDALIVATKAPALPAALQRIDGRPGIVVPLLNGLEHMPVLRERFGERVVAGSIRIEADRPQPTSVRHTSGFLRVDLGPGAGMEQEGLLVALAAALERAEVPARRLESEAQVLWSKLVRLNALACTTSAYDLPLGDIRADPQRRAELVAAVGEAVAVARAEGAELETPDTLAELEAAHAELRSSMQRDIAAGRPPELDAIAGAVLRAGARHGLRCPTIEELAARVAARAGLPAPGAPAPAS